MPGRQADPAVGEPGRGSADRQDDQPSHVVLLGAMNAGGRAVPIRDVVDLLTGLGWTGIATIRDRGNLVGTAPDPRADGGELTDTLESALATGFGQGISVVVLHRDELTTALCGNPFGTHRDPRRVHLISFARPRTADQCERLAGIARSLAADGSPDRAVCAGRVIYLHTPGGLARSRLAAAATRLPGDPAASAGILRDWSTVRRLAELSGLAHERS